MVHLGFAMAKIDAAHARETRAFLNELGLDL
jgi:hydrogenase maturation factor